MKKNYTFFDSLFSKILEYGSVSWKVQRTNLGSVFPRDGIFRFDLTLLELEIRGITMSKGRKMCLPFLQKTSKLLSPVC